MTGTERLHAGLAVLCIGLLIVKWLTLGTVNVNWDEFLYLSRVHDHLRGDLTSTFQSFHVHLFGWLASAGANEVDQIVAARGSMYVLRWISCIALFVVAQRVVGTTGAWFAVLVSLVFSFTWRHGEAFRADPMLVAAFLVAIAAYVRWPGLRTAVFAACVAAVSAAVSVKTAVYLPAAALVVFGTARRPVRDAAVAVGVALVAYAVLQLLHGASVGAAPTEAGVRATSVGARMWAAPRTDYLWRTLRADWLVWSLALVGTALAVLRLRRRDALVVIALLSPLAALALYRNTYPYFYVMLVPGLAVAGGVTAAWLARRSPVAVAVLAVALVGGAVIPATAALEDNLTHQREIVSVVHDAFPEPVAYFSRTGTIASYPRVGPFMSTFVMHGYRARGVARIEPLVRRHQPAFVLADVDALDLSLPPDEALASPYALLPGDFAFLQRHYVHYWGPVWVAGISVTAADAPERAEIVVSGDYRLEADGRVAVDGKSHENGAVVSLDAGMHTIALEPGATKATLRLGGTRPEAEPPMRWTFVPL